LVVSKRNRSILAAVVLTAFTLAAAQHGNERLPAKNAQPPAPELFKLLSPSVFVIETLDAKGIAIALGSGVSTTKDGIVTNRHVVEGGKAWRIRRGDNTWTARIAFVDSEHDLCGLQVNGLTATPVGIRASSMLSVGERVYAQRCERFGF
jgi:serine protease Do